MYNDYAAINANWWDLVMMMMFIGTETLVTQLVHEISRMQAC